MTLSEQQRRVLAELERDLLDDPRLAKLFGSSPPTPLRRSWMRRLLTRSRRR